MSPRFGSTLTWVRAVALVVVHPSVWWAAGRLALRIARPKWWRRAPFLPIPDAAYVRFRLETAYGPGISPEPRDLLAYLHWCAHNERTT
jgi:hypothetical protein